MWPKHLFSWGFSFLLQEDTFGPLDLLSVCTFSYGEVLRPRVVRKSVHLQGNWKGLAAAFLLPVFPTC